MERRFCHDAVKIASVTATPNGPAELFLSLQRFPNVVAQRMSIETDPYNNFRKTMLDIGLTLNRDPRTLVVCNVGVCRSYLLARQLVLDGLAELSTPNQDPKSSKAKGCGIDYLKRHGLAIDEQDVLILNYMTAHNRPGDREALTQIAMTLEQELEARGDAQNPLSVFWIEGAEEDFQPWMLR